MASSEERGRVYEAPCAVVPQTIGRGLGPEFIYPFVVLFFATVLRKLLRHYHISLPYTVILMLVGAVLGAFYQYELIKRFTFIADLTPVQILAIFLPILIFESAFSCDPHIFIKCLGQILILAILGFFISVALTTLAVMYWYENEHISDVRTCWTWDQAVLYSAVVSATDPVSVVSLLKSMTSLKTLSTVIEGESLLNDAAAITIYTLIKNLIYEATKSHRELFQETRATLLGVNSDRCAHAIRFLIKRKVTAMYLLSFVLKTIAAAVLIGYIMAHITIFTLYRIEAGELETCITITMSYFVYLTCEAVEASGVIGVVLLGLTLNMNRACFSVSAIAISEQTWQLLAYVANSLIFITVGVILLKTYSGSDKMLSLSSSLPQLLLIYIILILVRALMVLCIHFILKQIAYGFTWKDSIVTIWSGLRGGVSLVLALTLFNSKIKEQYQAEIMLIHTTAIVFLTCTVNALSIPKIVHLLRLDRTSELIKQTMLQIIKEVKIKQNDTIRSLKKNPILATADWLFVQKAIQIQSPFDHEKEDLTKDNPMSRQPVETVKCDHCQAHVTIPISKLEFKQTFEDCRIRILRLQKTHFWTNYYNGQLSSNGLHMLNSLCDRAIDTPKKFLDLKTIKAQIVGRSRVRTLLNLIRTCTHQWQKYLPWHYHENLQRSSDLVITSNKPSATRYSVLYTYFFRCLPFSFLIILTECVIIIYQLQTNLCRTLLSRALLVFHITLQAISSLLLVFDYIQLHYWIYPRKTPKFPLPNLIWIIIYTCGITCRAFSCIIFFALIIVGSLRQLCVAFYIFNSSSLIECLILCSFFIEALRLFVDYILNRYVSISYDIGLAYISSEEQVLRIIHRLTDNESIRIRIRELSLQHIKSVLNDVLRMQEAHPGTVISIKTHHTVNLLHNTAKRGIAQIRARGGLDVDDCDLLEQALKNMHVHLRIPSTMPPVSPMIVLGRLPWFIANERLTAQQRNEIEQMLLHARPNENTKRFENEPLLHPQSFSWQDFLWHKNDPLQGVYVLVNGIVEEWKLDPDDIDASHSELRWKESRRSRRATLTSQEIENSYDRTRFKDDYTGKFLSECASSSSDGKRGEEICHCLGASSTPTMNTIIPNTLAEEELVLATDTDSVREGHRIKYDRDRFTLLNDGSSYPHHSTSTTRVRMAFEDGFYLRWHHLMTNPTDHTFQDNITTVDDSFHHTRIEENFEEYFDETFEKYRQLHPATSERVHRRYAFGSGHCVGLYDLLTNNGDKHESTAKCLTNVTAFFISKQKLLEIFDAYGLWDTVWLATSIQLALRVLPNVSSFQHASMHPRSSRTMATDFTLINKRLLNAGLLICDERVCTPDGVLQVNEDLLLVVGSVRNQITKCVYESPIFIRRSLSRQGLKLLDGHSATKILILPRVLTSTASHRLFTDSALIQHILNDETKRDTSHRPNNHKQSIGTFDDVFDGNQDEMLSTQTTVDTNQ